MPLEEEIVTWSASRPAWQRAVLRDLALGRVPATGEVEDFATQLVARVPSSSPPLTLADLPGSSRSGERVRVRSVQPLEHVNALVDGQVLTFASEGMTVVYGDNASGKSGYARILKKVAGARHQESVLTDIFEDRPDAAPSAVVSVEVGEEVIEQPLGDDANPALHRICYFDEGCGDDYIETESDVTYRPSALVLLDGLIETCDAVREELDRRLVVNAQARPPLPAFEAGTAAADFFAGLTGTTPADEVAAACTAPLDVDAQIASLAGEEARLRQSDPASERARWGAVAANLDKAQAHFASLTLVIGKDAATDLDSERRRTTELRAAAVVASSSSFDSYPVSGVGSETWRSLWEASKRFAETEAYIDREFPMTEPGDRCPLCQQDLAPEAADRFHAFHLFMSDDVERQATLAASAFRAHCDRLSSLAVMPGEVALALSALEAVYPEVVERCRSAAASFDRRRQTLLASSEDPSTTVAGLPADVVPELFLLAEDAQGRASSADAEGFTRQVEEASTARMELEGRRMLALARDAVGSEVARLRERAAIEVAKRDTDTSQITRKSTELTRGHVNEVLRDQFTRRSDRLRLERVTLKDEGGRKGQLRQRPAFLDAAQNAEIPQVLSEGEQTALGLAGFLTEAHFDESRSAMVLDDPVTSLDHIRRAYVAAELADFARTRQVIVFTHELAFVGELRKATESAEVQFTERSVERRGDGGVGVCFDHHPWKAQDAGARLGNLEAQLVRIKREASSWDQETYEREVAEWSGSLSETWERIVNLDIVYRVVDRGTSEVRPKLFRLLARITDDDNNEFQQSYARCSQWARRHDKSPELNYVAPETSQLEDELAIVRNWHARVRRYANE